MGEVPLAGEGIILSFTDGLTDLQNEAGDYFEDEEILRVFSETMGATAIGFNQHLQKRLDEFRGNQAFTDDIAVLTCRFNA